MKKYDIVDNYDKSSCEKKASINDLKWEQLRFKGLKGNLDAFLDILDSDGTGLESLYDGNIKFKILGEMYYKSRESKRSIKSIKKSLKEQKLLEKEKKAFKASKIKGNVK